MYRCIQVNTSLRIQISIIQINRPSYMHKFSSRLITFLDLQSTDLPHDCRDLLERGERCSDVYTVNITTDLSRSAYCDMDTSGGGWTVKCFMNNID